MPALLAMAGLGEAAEQMILFVGWSGLVAVRVLLAVRAALRSWVPTAVGLGVWVLLTLTLQPWRAFASIPVEYADDPDVHRWASAERMFAIAWIVVSVLAAVLVATKRARQMSPADAET